MKSGNLLKASIEMLDKPGRVHAGRCETAVKMVLKPASEAVADMTQERGSNPASDVIR